MREKRSKIGIVLNGFGNVLMYGAVVVGLFFVVTHFILGWHINPAYGGGMVPSLGGGDVVVVIDTDRQR